MNEENIIETLKKTRDVADDHLVNAFIEACFSFIKENWPEYPKCKYPTKREKNDWIYMNQTYLKWYLAYRKRRGKRG